MTVSESAAPRRAPATGRRERPPVTQQDDWETVLRPWLHDACAALEIADSSGDVDTIHSLTGVVATGVQRSMAPISSYLVGLAVGRGMPLEEAIARVVSTVPVRGRA
jgi:hypothetical protein